MLESKIYCNQWVNKVLTLALISIIALLVVLPCSAQMSYTQLDPNQLNDVNFYLTGLSKYPTLFSYPILTDLTNSVTIEPIQNDQYNSNTQSTINNTTNSLKNASLSDSAPIIGVSNYDGTNTAQSYKPLTPSNVTYPWGNGAGYLPVRNDPSALNRGKQVPQPW